MNEIGLDYHLIKIIRKNFNRHRRITDLYWLRGNTFFLNRTFFREILL